MSSEEPLQIDGSVLEGGGQLLRIAVALSALLSRPVAINNIRANRKPPGLKYQHAAGLRLVAEICSARLEGCETGSSSVLFHPQAKPHLGKAYTADPGTAGSIALLLQVSLPCLLFGSPTDTLTSLTLHGGTNAAQAPQVDHTTQVFLPFLQQHFALRPTLTIVTRGYYPRGGGEVRATIPAVHGPLPSTTLIMRGTVRAVYGRAWVAGLPRSLAEAMRSSATQTLTEAGFVPPQTRIEIDAVREKPAEAVGSGSGVVLWAEMDGGCILGGSALGRKGVDPVQVGRDAARELLDNLAHGGCVDEYMQDQMIIFLALAQGKSKIRTGPLTLHTRTAIWVVEQMSDARFTLTEDGTGVTIECEGIGYSADVSNVEIAQP